MLGKKNTTKDPEIESKEGQLNDISEGIRTGQLDLVQLGSDKKRVAQEIADMKTAHDADLLKAESESRQKVTELTADIKTMGDKAVVLYKEIDNLTKEKSDLTLEIEPLKEENKKQTNLLTTIKDSIQPLLEQKTALGDEVTVLKTSIAMLTTQKGNLETDIVTLSSDKETLGDKINNQNIILETAKSSEILSMQNRLGHEAKIIELVDQLDLKTKELANIQTPLADLKKEVGELTASKESTLKEISDKKSATDADTEEKKIALTTLEARVDEKIRIFKEYKAQFAVDELAKMKINTDL